MDEKNINDILIKIEKSADDDGLFYIQVRENYKKQWEKVGVINA